MVDLSNYTMDNSEAIRRIATHMRVHKMGEYPHEFIKIALDKAIEALNNEIREQWIPVSKKKPKPFVSVLTYMPGEEPFPTVREGYMADDGTWVAGLFMREKGEVTHWKEMPLPPKEES